VSRRSTKQRRAARWRGLEQMGHKGWIGAQEVIARIPSVGLRSRRAFAAVVSGLHRRGWRVSTTMDGWQRRAPRPGKGDAKP